MFSKCATLLFEQKSILLQKLHETCDDCLHKVLYGFKIYITDICSNAGFLLFFYQSK